MSQSLRERGDKLLPLLPSGERIEVRGKAKSYFHDFWCFLET
jgi:hypothetical protein